MAPHFQLHVRLPLRCITLRRTHCIVSYINIVCYERPSYLRQFLQQSN